MNGVPMGVIAAELDHADTRMTEKHYAHLAPNCIAQTIRANFPRLGFNPEGDTVVPFRSPFQRSESKGHPERIPMPLNNDAAANLCWPGLRRLSVAGDVLRGFPPPSPLVGEWGSM